MSKRKSVPQKRVFKADSPEVREHARLMRELTHSQIKEQKDAAADAAREAQVRIVGGCKQ